MKSNENNARADSNFYASGALLLALKHWAGVPEQFPYGIGVLILNYVLFQSQLIPRWLSVWGLVGGVLIIAMGFLRMFGHPVVYLAIPILLNELVLAVWLIVVGIDSYAITSAIVGVLFITALVSTFLSGVLAGSIDKPDYLTAVSADEIKVLIGVLFQLTLTASVVAIPIFMFPILSDYNEILALGYVGARIFEGFFDVLIAISMLLLLTLSREFVKAGTPTAKIDIDEAE